MRHFKSDSKGSSKLIKLIFPQRLVRQEIIKLIIFRPLVPCVSGWPQLTKRFESLNWCMRVGTKTTAVVAILLGFAYLGDVPEKRKMHKLTLIQINSDQHTMGHVTNVRTSRMVICVFSESAMNGKLTSDPGWFGVTKFTEGLDIFAYFR